MATVFGRFHRAHRQAYGYAAEGDIVEVVNLRLTALANLPQPKLTAKPLRTRRDPKSALRSYRDVFFRNQPVSTSIYERSKLLPGDVLTGPAIIEQLDSTTVVWPDQTASVDAYNNLLLESVQV